MSITKIILLLVTVFLISFFLIFYVPWFKISIGLIVILIGFYFWNKKGSKNADK